MIEQILELFGLDFFSSIWNFVSSLFNLLKTGLQMCFELLSYIYLLNPIISVILIIGMLFGVLLGLLSLIKQIPFL